MSVENLRQCITDDLTIVCGSTLGHIGERVHLLACTVYIIT